MGLSTARHRDTDRLGLRNGSDTGLRSLHVSGRTKLKEYPSVLPRPRYRDYTTLPRLAANHTGTEGQTQGKSLNLMSDFPVLDSARASCAGRNRPSPLADACRAWRLSCVRIACQERYAKVLETRQVGPSGPEISIRSFLARKMAKKLLTNRVAPLRRPVVLWGLRVCDMGSEV